MVAAGHANAALDMHEAYYKAEFEREDLGASEANMGDICMAGDLSRLRDLGSEGTTAQSFAGVLGKSPDTARRALDAFAERGWARRIEGRPTRYVATEGAPDDF